MLFQSLADNLRVILVGTSGGIGSALFDRLVESEQVSQIYSLSRNQCIHSSPKVSSLGLDFTSDASLAVVAETLRESGAIDLCIVATGLLQGQGISPEKNINALSFEGFEKSFLINTIGPAMCAKFFLPLMRRDRKAVFAALSARVGSISDNRLGGWYGYRASKAALNMVLKTLAIEYGRRCNDIVVIGLHPGTVDTDLSRPFQAGVPEGKLFTPDYSATRLLAVIDQVTPKDSGLLFDWSGKAVPF